MAVPGKSNIGLGGLFLKTSTPLKPGRELGLKLHLPGIEGSLKIKSQVVWIRKPEESRPGQPPGMGIKFREMSKVDQQRLKAFLDELG